jgi:hypothetical protein
VAVAAVVAAVANAAAVATTSQFGHFKIARDCRLPSRRAAKYLTHLTGTADSRAEPLRLQENSPRIEPSPWNS